jgi:hypothetical protein
MAAVILPVLVPINYLGGRGGSYALEFENTNGVISGNTSVANNVTGLDQLAWGNVRPDKTHRYWAHLILAIAVIVWVCGVFFAELRVYIKVRQDYLTTAEHRLRASATTVLVTAIPQKWLTTDALSGLYDVFPGGIRNIWINRSFDALLDKIKERDGVFKKLESAETDLIKMAKKAQKKQQKKDDKKAARASKAKPRPLTKGEKVQKAKDEDANAEMLAQNGGVSSGDPEHQVPHTVDDAIEEEAQRAREQEPAPEAGGKPPPQTGSKFTSPILGGLAAVGKGFEAVGGTVVGGARNVGKDFNNQIETTNGFTNIDNGSMDDSLYDQFGRYRPRDPSPRPALTAPTGPFGAGTDDKEIAMTEDTASPSSSRNTKEYNIPGSRLPGNTVRKLTFHQGIDGTADQTGKNWWQFWKPPSGGFASPLPTDYEHGDEFPLTANGKGRRIPEKKSLFNRVKALIPFINEDESEPVQYPVAYNEEYKEDASGAAWEKYLEKNDRPTHRIPRYSWVPGWLGVYLLSTKVDTIYYCRGELARLNLEIELDQKHPERFPLMNSAFIQFNHQVAAHMAAQSVSHHVPKHMAPRTVEISPDDVIWENMSIKWWEAWFRTAVVTAFVAGMIILWTFPVAFTAAFAQISTLANKYSWLNWLNNIPDKVLQAIQGVLPALLLGLLLALVPPLLNYLAFLSGVQTGMQKQNVVQNFYFAFLFVQVFLVVSISGGTIASLSNAASDFNLKQIPDLLATELPKATNYFFSYMILQALSVSSSTILQLTTLIFWFILPKIFDSTARQKWKRNTSLQNVKWGTYFPVYTNFACIALIYSVIAPIIIIFAIITFTLLWIANRYNMLYVVQFKLDTGGLLYPTAINQTFTGLYVMELCLVGLFLLVQDEAGSLACVPHAIIMVVSIILTVGYQALLNMSFAPLFRHLPITFEDEAVLRDEAFEHAQAIRLGLLDEEEAVETENDGIELSNLNQSPTSRMLSKLNPVKAVQQAGSWAAKSALRPKNVNRNSSHGASVHSHHQIRKRRHRDIEEQKKIADALYGGFNDELEDLTPDERDVLVKHAFQHYALRARRPILWLPRDDIGVSDDEVRRTRDFANQNIWISNVGAALDSKCRVVYGRNPPDFSEIDLINL